MEETQIQPLDSNTTVRCLECNPIRDITRSNSIKRQSPKCYNCHEHGHVRATCPLKDSDRKEIINKRLEQRIKETADFFKNNKLEQIRGNCLIDNKLCNFLTDTGSSRTIVNRRIFSSAELEHVKPTSLRFVAANGSVSSCVGIKRCEIKHGDFTCLMELIVANDIEEDCIIGMDYLRVSPLTQYPIYALKQAIDKGSFMNNEITSSDSFIKVNRINLIESKQNTLDDGLTTTLSGRPSNSEVSSNRY